LTAHFPPSGRRWGRRFQRLARCRRCGDVVLAADTIVVIDGEILGKPAGLADAKRMIELLSGRTHRVYTGACLISPAAKQCFAEWADVTFAKLTREEAKAYIETKEGLDKAGAYAVQGFAARFVKSIEGDFYSVVGLPVHRVYEALQRPCFAKYLL
jgi:septum formation protein